MSDFNPVTLFHIFYESVGLWLWPLLFLATLVLYAIVSGLRILRVAGRPATRPLIATVVVGLATAVVFTFLVPFWTHADPGSLSAPVDYVFAFLIALAPAGVVASLVFSLAARRCAAKSEKSA